MRFSFVNVALQALAHNSGWPEQWRNPEPKAAYDAVIIGAGGHGLATAYYLAKEHGLTNVAVLEKGWLGGGNTGRNTTIIRSNYLWEESAALYEHALKLWEGLSQELNYNVMYSPRGVLMLAHNTHDVQVGKAPRPRQSPGGRRQRMADAGRGQGLLPDPQHRARRSLSDRRRGACSGAAARRGTTRSPGAMRARRRRAASTSSRIARRRRSAATLPAPSPGVETTRGAIATKKIGVVAAGHTSVVMAMAGVRMPLESYPLAGAGVRAGQADDALRRDVEHDPRLHVAIGQGRTRHRRRHRRLYVLFADRRPAHRQSYAGGDLRNLSRRCAACACCATGAASST